MLPPFKKPKLYITDKLHLVKVDIYVNMWCAVQNSNLRPSPRQGDALPTELTAHLRIIITKPAKLF